jgi:hypothetical protein
MHLTRINLERDVVERFDAREILTDPAQFE